jgi:iron complex outermembrane receptor protein
MKTGALVYLALAVAAAGTFGGSRTAWAQGEAAARGELEEITVTARRIEESLQDAPVSVAAFTAKGLRDRMVVNTEQLDQITPNLQFTNATTLAGNNKSSNIFIRGVGQIDPTSSVDPGVGLYIDDVYISQSIGATMDFRDIQSVQVLRGPQGTLFGKNSVGGAILLTTNDPGDEFGGTIRAGTGSDSLADLFIAVDAPLSDTVKSRFSFGTRQQDGYVTRVQTGEDLGDTSVWTLTGKVAFAPGGRLNARFQFDYTDADENGIPFVFAAANETATFPIVASADAGCPGAAFPAPVPMIDDDRCANDFQNKGPHANNGTHPMESILENWGVSFHLDYGLTDVWDLSSVTAYRSIDWEGIRDADNTPLTILHTDYDSDGDQFSQELRLQYTSEGLSGTAGVFYFEEEIDDIVLVQLNDPAPGIQEDSDNNVTENSSWAVFTQWTYAATDQLSLTLGGRYTEDTKGSTPDQFNYVNPDAKYLPVQLYEDTFTDFSMTASASYHWSERVMTYLSYAEAFKGGGWNSHFNTCQILEPCASMLGLVPGTPPHNNAVAASQAFALGIHSFGPEEAATWEIGFKMDLVERTLRLNGAVFTTDYDDLQFTYRSGVAPYLANAGKASIDGFELELTWLPTEQWTIEGGVGNLDSSVDSLREIAGTGIGVLVGNRLPFTPEWQFNLGVGFNGLLGNGWMIAPRVDWSYRDDTFWDANNTPEIAVDSSYSILNASVIVGPDAGSLRARAGVTNATDEIYSTGGNSSLTTGAGYAEIGYARPREYYLMFEYDF